MKLRRWTAHTLDIVDVMASGWILHYTISLRWQFLNVCCLLEIHSTAMMPLVIDIDLEWHIDSTWFWIDVRPLVRHSTSSVRHLMKEPTRLELHLRWVVTGEVEESCCTTHSTHEEHHRHQNLWWKKNTLGFEVKRRVRARERVSVYDALVAPVSSQL